MDCSDLSPDRLADPDSPAIRAHLDRCAGCRERHSELRRLGEELAALGRALPRAEDPALVRRILARIPRSAVPANAGWRWAGGLAAAAALLVAVLLANRRTPSDSPTDIVALPPALPVNPFAPPPSPAPVPKDPATPPALPLPLLVPQPPAPPTPRPATAPPSTPPDPREPSVTPPVEGPKTPPPETKPQRLVLALANLEGSLEMQEGDVWRKVTKSADWDAAGAIRAGDKMARFALADGTRTTLRPHSEVRLLAADPPSFALEKGEGYFEVIPGAGRRFSVSTPDARIDVTGTQFSVKRGDRTEILVSSGEVKVTNDKGEVSVPAGTGATARRGSAPTKPRVLDTDRANAWRRDLDAPETARFRFDFEDGRLPPLWVKGKVVAGPARGLNHSCLEGNPGIDADLSRLDRRVATVHGTLKFRFRYWTAGADALWVQLFSERVRDNLRFEVKTLGKEKWEAVEIPLSDFYRLADGSAHLITRT